MEYQLVIQLPIDNDIDFDMLIEIEDHLEKHLSNEHIVDGHDFGSGQMNIFIYTNKPELAFSHLKEIITQLWALEISAAYRDIDGEEYTWLWPSDAKGEFLII
ncbi:MAG: hypothetical protein D3914_05110 [Candidatus Electrothrix sp. LOE2]|jgi:hypothetical protein|nr:hypothetical protein [Candidatus Electrothrix sp. LOE2]